MSTKMDENDWAHTLAVFRACLPRRGRKAEDDRRLLQALHFFTAENVRWRALPERFDPWNSVWRRFDRLSKAGVFEAFFDTLELCFPAPGFSRSPHCRTSYSGFLVWARKTLEAYTRSVARRIGVCEAEGNAAMVFHDLGPTLQARTPGTAPLTTALTNRRRTRRHPGWPAHRFVIAAFSWSRTNI